MRNVLLASALGTLAGAFAVPAIGGPVHYQVTRAYSLYGVLPAHPSNGPTAIVLGTAPLDFVMTDVMVSGWLNNCVVTVNGTPVFASGRSANGPQGDTHMTSGIFIPAGSTVGVQTNNMGGEPIPVTLAGYVQ